MSDAEIPPDPAIVFEVVGEAQVRRLAAAFYRRIPADELLSPMYPAGGMDAAERRLADFLIYRFGGPQTYLHERGQPRLRMRHAPFAITRAARDRWVQLMDAAIDECEWPPQAVAAARPFLHDSATFLINRS